jgi:protein gp37
VFGGLTAGPARVANISRCPQRISSKWRRTIISTGGGSAPLGDETRVWAYPRIGDAVKGSFGRSHLARAKFPKPLARTGALGVVQGELLNPEPAFLDGGAFHALGNGLADQSFRGTAMSDVSSIEWTDATWNPVTGCTKISQGCKHCYAARFAERWRGISGHPFENGFELTLRPDRLEVPLQWKQPRRIFVNSMSDLFHPGVPEWFIRRVFDTMGRAPRHTFQILTKRADRLAELGDWLPWAPNIWQGVSVEDQRVIDRVDKLRAVPAQVRFLSLEPLIGPLDRLDLTGIHWVIVGGESGPGARPMEPAWVDSIQRQCTAARVPFFFKQWGGPVKSLRGRTLNGRTWDAMPPLQVAE